MDDGIAVRRFAIKYNPPTLVVEYKLGSGLFLKKIKIKSAHSTNPEGLCHRLAAKYPDVLSPDKIDSDQLLDLIRLLLSGQETEYIAKKYQDIDLNKVDDETLEKAKRSMDVNFERNRLKPGDPQFVWDKQVEFTGGEEECDWDEESD